MRRPIFGVFGGNKVEDHVVRAATALGGQIARRDAVLLTGGVPGPKQVKQAAMQGALDARADEARLIGVLKEKESGPACTKTQRFITTGLSNAERNPINILTSDAVIVMNGDAGTLAELGFALEANKPIFFFAGSFGVLRSTFNNNNEQRSKLRDLLKAGTPKYVEFSGKRHSSDIEKLLGDLFNNQSIDGHGESAVAELVQKAIDGLGDAYKFMASEFPGLDGVLTKTDFEKWLCEMP